MFAELVCRSNFSFLRGASHPEELVFTASRAGLSALALTDQDGLHGAVKAHLAAQSLGLKLILGTQLTLTDAPPIVLYVQDAAGYSNLCQLISQGRLSHPKGEAGLPWQELAQRSRGVIALLRFPAEMRQGGPLGGSVSGG